MFRNVGFLDPASGADFQRALAPHAAELALANQVNACAMRELWKLEIPTSQKHLAVGGMLYVRAVRSYQAAYLLLERGMCVESMASMRVIIECVILMAKLRVDPEYAEILEAEQERHRISHAAKMVAFRDRLSTGVATKMIELATQPVPSRGQSLESIAVEVGLEVLYQSMYRGVSGYAAHATLGALERSLKVIDGLPEMTFSQDAHLVDEVLSHLVPLGIDALNQLGSLFQMGKLSDDVMRLSTEWQALARSA